MLRKDLKVDVAYLQTLHDFDDWARRGLLTPYKPIGWDQVLGAYKDLQARFTGLFMLTFANSYNKNMVTEANAQRNYSDFLKPESKDRIIIAYPHYDDAVLYVFDKNIQKYGIDFIAKLQANGVQWVRGTQTPRDAVEQGKYTVSAATSGAFVPVDSANTRFVLPTSAPFLTWAQTGAIFKDAKHPAAAQLYVSWMLSKPAHKDTRSILAHSSEFLSKGRLEVCAWSSHFAIARDQSSLSTLFSHPGFRRAGVAKGPSCRAVKKQQCPKFVFQ